MELHHLRTFVVVAEEKNVTKAAKRLFMTPPAVSAHIKALEEELNVTLFTRTPQGMAITEKGELLKSKAEQTLRAAQDLVNHATQMQSYLMGRLVIGLNASPSFLRIGPLVTQMTNTCPGIELSFASSVSGKILDSLQAGALDAGFVFGPSPLPTIITRRLTTADLVIAAPKSWEAQIVNATWETLAKMPWISSPYYCPFQSITDDLFKRRGLQYSQVVQADDETTKCELVSADVGLALLEKHEAEQAASAGRIVIGPSEPIQCDLSFARLTARQHDPLIAALENELIRIWDSD